MKKLFTLMLFTALVCSSAFAEGDGQYYWFYDRAEVTTTGKGLIYLSSDYQPEEDKYAEEYEYKFKLNGTPTTTICYHAKPADGYQFIGMFPTDKPNAFSERITKDNSLDGEITNVGTERATESDEVEGYGFEPDNTFYAVFSKVYVEVADAMKRAGSVDMDKPINDRGDKVTINATSTLEGCEFDYWLDSKGNKITENPYTITVGDEIETYTAYFKGNKILNIDFGEGKFIPFSTNYLTDFEDGIQRYTVNKTILVFWSNDTLVRYDEENKYWYYSETVKNDKGEDEDIHKPYTGAIQEFNSNYQVDEITNDYTPNTGVILYGEGVKTIVLYEERDKEIVTSDDTYLVGTTTGAVNIESLKDKDVNNNKYVYYVLDGNAFVRATSGTVAENTCYLRLTDGIQYPLPEIIYVRAEDDPTAITNVNTDKKIQFIGVYTINGKKVEAPIKGLNIVNGKKVLIK